MRYASNHFNTVLLWTVLGHFRGQLVKQGHSVHKQRLIGRFGGGGVLTIKRYI